MYCLKTNLAIWYEYLSGKLKIVGFGPSKADSELWIRDTGNHYRYIAVYSDDLPVFSKNPVGVLQGINTLFQLKFVGRPEFYLIGDIDVHKDDTSTFHYVNSARTYINNVCNKIETLVEINIRN